MYETEANHRIEPLDQLSEETQRRFKELTDGIQARTLLPWGEHCTECVWPTCYTTCDLYSPREDMRCRRFVDGMVRLECPGSPNGYLLKISFKRWGKLWTPGNVRLYTNSEAKTREARDYRIGTAIVHVPMPTFMRKAVSGKRYYMKTTLAKRRRPAADLPTSFVLECYNPGADTVAVSLTMRPQGESSKIPFQRLLELTPGFVRIRVPVEELGEAFVGSSFDVELTPNEIPDGTTLYFGLMDFVRERAAVSAANEVKRHKVNAGGAETNKDQTSTDQSKRVKCVVWDLDNTLWEGTFIEDGATNLRLKPEIVEVIQELDRRGILQSVASKNNQDDVWPIVASFGLAEFFLFPQISWLPKSTAMETIAKKLNIGRDTLLFVDDSTFELEQVKAACPDVRAIHASEAPSLLSRPDCDVPVTAEGASRRQLYQQDAVRQEFATAFAGDYLSFLKDCKLELTLKPLHESNIERVHELTQRTNQMNFSGTRYDRKVLEQILTMDHLDTYVLECRDRFGNYGIIGFSIVDRREPRMTDLMFSCRVQSKRVEHAFLSYLFRRYSAAEASFWANYRKTSRNAPSGQVFADVGMEEVETHDGVTSLVLRRGQPILDDAIVTIKTERSEAVELLQASE